MGALVRQEVSRALAERDREEESDEFFDLCTEVQDEIVDILETEKLSQAVEARLQGLVDRIDEGLGTTPEDEEDDDEE
jgi:hypothetical protein